MKNNPASLVAQRLALATYLAFLWVCSKHPEMDCLSHPGCPLARVLCCASWEAPSSQGPYTVQANLPLYQ